jgi:eukaryotic-like serine/threonine-protein kinase
MTPENWEKVSHIFNEAVALRPDERIAFVEEACEGDETLRLEVMSLLSAHDEAGDDFIENAAAETVALDVSEMPTLTGTLFSHYRIEKSVGRGGMGHIYLAADTRLDRSVALKKLPDRYAADPHFLKRFRTEARAAATLNHPNVATIYSVEDFEGTPFITMEYVEGKTLDAVTPSGGMELGQFLDLFIQISEALQHAHEKGITHRDIKPGNVVISTDGNPKILDFGLAQIAEDSQKTLDSRKSTITQPGQIIGTPSYMSPEQAQGKRIDHRTDVFSLGVVMYEAITGVRPFRGENNAEIVSNLLKSEPRSVSELRPDVPLLVAGLIERCIQKRRRERPQSMQEVGMILGEARTLLKTGVSTGSLGRHLYRETVSSGRGWLIAGGASVLVLAFLGWYFFPALASHPPISFEKMTMRRLSQTNNIGYSHISADGRSVAFATVEENNTRALWIRRVDDRNALQIVPPQNVQFWGGLAISEDGGQVFYVTADPSGQRGTLYKVSALGGPPRKLVDMVNDVGGISPDGQRVLFVRYGEVNRILTANTSDGSGEQIVRSGQTDAEVLSSFRDPQFSPDGKSIFYVKYERIEGIEYWSLVALSLASDTETQILRQKERIGEIAVLHDGSGVLISAMDPLSNLQQLFHVSLPDGKRTRITNDLNFYFGISVDRYGRNIVSSQRNDEQRVWVGEASSLSTMKPLTPEPNAHQNVEWSPDGRIVYDAYENNRAHIWIADADGKNVQQLTSSESDDSQPRVSGDGRYIVFTSKRSGLNQIWRMNIDGTDQVLLTDVSGAMQRPVFGADGETVVFEWIRDRDRVLGKVPVTGGSVQEMPLSDGMPIFNAYFWAMSPDGKYVAYTIRDEAEGKTKVAVKLVGSSEPPTILNIWPSQIFKWMPDGQSIYYRERQFGYQPESEVQKIDIKKREPKLLMSVAPESILDMTFSRDGKRFAVVRGKGTSNAVMLTTAAEK